ncbi:MAG: serine protease [Treponema sp.]|nr:MAG: serine protease [Treponema sp.]
MQKSKSKITAFAAVISVCLTCFILLAARCSSDPGSANTLTAYADTGVDGKISGDSIGFLEKLQKANRELAAYILPSVVTVDVIETRVVDNGGQNFPWFFFNQPDSPEGNKREYKQEGLGSGFIVKQSGKKYYVLTNQHVTGNASDITIILNTGEKIKGELVGTDKRKDIALVSFESNKDLQVAKMGDSNTVQVGDPVFAVGSPMGYVSSITSGMISALGRSGGPNENNINDFFQTDAAINQGNSGGPLVNIYGEVIGINNWIASSSGGSQGLGFSIPINNVKRAVDDFIEYGEVKYGWLGVQLTPITPEDVQSLGLKDQKGTLVAQIFLDSPAIKGGMQAGDFIIELNGKPVESYDELVRNVGDLTIGEKASFKVIRNGQKKEIEVKIESREENIVSDYAKLWPGFVAYTITPKIREQLKLDKKLNGVLVTNIQTKTPAVLMGLKNADVVVSVNDKSVSNLREFYAELAKAKGEVWFKFVREGKEFSTIRYKLK